MELGTTLQKPFFELSDLVIDDFNKVCSQETALVAYPFASGCEKNIVIYEGDLLRRVLESGSDERAVRSELHRCLSSGPGVFVIKQAYADKELIDRITDVFHGIIAAEKADGQTQGDHFGQNERIWNSLQKVCVRAPELYIDYYGDALLALACRAWLGPSYQITAQVNNVKPGSASQSPHRDYHLGFQSNEEVAKYPAVVQHMSQYLTLQGAIAHTDMPLMSGPTLFLPYSQQYAPGYLAYRDQAFVEYFEANHVQLPLGKGDAVFFSPALFHGAGTNQSSNDRLANLVQISSAFGRTMETIDRDAMVASVYPVLVEKAQSMSALALRDVIASLADGYSFPTNLDSDPPVDGNAPKTGQALLHEAITAGWSLDQLKKEMAAYRTRRRA